MDAVKGKAEQKQTTLQKPEHDASLGPGLSDAYRPPSQFWECLGFALHNGKLRNWEGGEEIWEEGQTPLPFYILCPSQGT